MYNNISLQSQAHATSVKAYNGGGGGSMILDGEMTVEMNLNCCTEFQKNGMWTSGSGSLKSQTLFKNISAPVICHQLMFFLILGKAAQHTTTCLCRANHSKGIHSQHFLQLYRGKIEDFPFQLQHERPLKWSMTELIKPLWQCFDSGQILKMHRLYMYRPETVLHGGIRANCLHAP